MNEVCNKAQFWKCALQVNSSKYIEHRGKEQKLTENEYNQQLLQVCLEENIKVLGIADHRNVDSIEAIRSIMKPEGILVFPGFEIASSEGIHFVCLYPENTSEKKLNRYLGNLYQNHSEEGVRPSEKASEEIFDIVESQKGFIYAAHCTNDGGLLKKKLGHIWKNEKLKACQIPGGIEDLGSANGNFYKQVILNKEKNYKRESRIAVINAKDVEDPETLRNPAASCRIKMTKPSFEAFKMAFQDPELRVCLNSNFSDKHHSRIESLSVKEGYLDNLHIDFSEHLNAIIGGRGTGKSTLLECIRYALELEPIGEKAKSQHEGIIDENIGKSKGCIELLVRSSKMRGKKYIITRYYEEEASVKDEAGNTSRFEIKDILPKIEIYGQNEIHEIAQKEQSQNELLERFLTTDHGKCESKIRKVLEELEENRKNLLSAGEDKANAEEESKELTKLQERMRQLDSLGIKDKERKSKLLRKESSSKQDIEKKLSILEKVFSSIRGALPDKAFLSNEELEKLPHAGVLKRIKEKLDQLITSTESMLSKWQSDFSESKEEIDKLFTELQQAIQQAIENDEEEFNKEIKKLPPGEQRSVKEMHTEHEKLQEEMNRIESKQTSIADKEAVIDELQEQRDSLHKELSLNRSERTTNFNSSLKKLNKRLKDKLKLSLKTKADRQPVIDFLLKCNLENVGEKRLQFINEKNDFSPVELAKSIQKGEQELQDSWDITPAVAQALSKLPYSKILELEEQDFPDSPEIELNIAQRGEPNYRSLAKLSTGQQCTAILHLLLLQNEDTLIVDQPEDNLDNAFIADRIVAELRKEKNNRQFIFATHNANIPVVGDAEWIGVLESSGELGIMSAQGSIDSDPIREKATSILEGGEIAFKQRKLKYGY